MNGVWATIVTATLVLVAGCVSPVQTNDNSSNGDEEPPSLPTPLYLSLNDIVPHSESPEDTVPVDWSWGEYVAGVSPWSWRYSSLLEPRSYIVHNATLDVTFQTDEAALSTQTRPQFTAWFGDYAQKVSHVFVEGPDLMAPGETHAVRFEFVMPPGGLVFVDYGGPEILLGSYYTDAQRLNTIDALVGGDRAPLHLETTPFAVPAMQQDEILQDSAMAVGGRCVAPGEHADLDTFRMPFEVGPEHVKIEAVALPVGEQIGMPDIDFVLYDGAGDFVVEAGSPGALEQIDLYTPNLENTTLGTWEMMVFVCGAQATHVAWQVRTFVAAPEAQPTTP